MDLPWHPAAELLPLMNDADLREFAEDIRANGLQHPILLLDGAILDGRNRHRACLLVGVEPRFEHVDPATVGDPFLRVASLNLHRRHLSESQRAMVGARLKEHFAAQARERMLAGRAADPTANLREGAGEASAQAAAAVSVSTRSVDAAARVLAKGTPELVQSVERGDVAVSAAAEVARLPITAQVAVVEQGPRAVASAAKHAREERRVKPEPRDEDDFEDAPGGEVERFEFSGVEPKAAALDRLHERPLDLGRLAPAEMDGLSREGEFVELARTFRERLAALIAKHPIESLSPPRRERVYGELHRTLIDVAKALPESEQKAPASRWNPVVVAGGKS